MEGLNSLLQAARARAQRYRNSKTFIAMIYMIKVTNKDNKGCYSCLGSGSTSTPKQPEATPVVI